MGASEKAVAAVMETLGCAYYQAPPCPEGCEWCTGPHCSAHGSDESKWTDRGCPVAVAAADAAILTDRPSIQAQALREAARDLGECDGISRSIGMDPLPAAVRAEKRAQSWLRERADRIEAQP